MRTQEEKESYKQGVVDALVNTAEHFINWHNSKSLPDKRISPDWYEQYKKECGNGQ